MTQATTATPARSDGPRSERSAALDGLRGVAILGVLLFHTGHLTGGFLGVDLFFALSGYLITGLLLRAHVSTGTVSLVAFWGRRLRRLMPALITMLAAVTGTVLAVGSTDLVRTTLSDGPWVQANLINWHLLADGASYWDRFGTARVFEHLWSIAVEEQFYLAWPLLILLAGRHRRDADRPVAVLAVVGSLASLALMVLLFDPSDPTRVYTGTDTRAFSLLLGALAACAPVRAAVARRAGPHAGVVSAVLVIGLGAGWLTVDETTSPWLYRGGLFLHSLAAALLVLSCAQSPRTRVARALGVAPLRWLGEISYGLYLWHWPIAVLLSTERTGLDGWARTIVVCVVSIATAALSKRLVEDPIRFRARWARGRRGFLVCTAVTMCLGLLWLVVPAPAPAPIDVSDLGATPGIDATSSTAPGWPA